MTSYDFQQTRLARFLVQLDENLPTVRHEVLSAKWVRDFEHRVRLLPRSAQHGPSDSCLEKCIDEPDLDQIEKSKSEALVDRFPLTVPQRRRLIAFLPRGESVAPQPAADPTGGHARQTRSVENCVNAGVEEV